MMELLNLTEANLALNKTNMKNFVKNMYTQYNSTEHDYKVKVKYQLNSTTIGNFISDLDSLQS